MRGHAAWPDDTCGKPMMFTAHVKRHPGTARAAQLMSAAPWHMAAEQLVLLQIPLMSLVLQEIQAAQKYVLASVSF